MASLSGVWNVQDFTDDGAPLVGGRLYTYVQGTTTQKTAYTDAAATVAHTYTSDGAGGQYIALNARGELPAPLYLTTGSYDLLLKRADASTVWTRRADPIGADLAASSGAGLIGTKWNVAGAISTTVQGYIDALNEVPFELLGGVGDYDPVANTGTDNAAAFSLARTAGIAGAHIRFKTGAKYKTTAEIQIHSNMNWIGDDGYTPAIYGVFASSGKRIIKSPTTGAQLTNVSMNGLTFWRWGANAEHGALIDNVDGLYVDIKMLAASTAIGGAFGVSAFYPENRPSKNCHVAIDVEYGGNFGLQYGNVDGGSMLVRSAKNSMREVIGLEPYALSKRDFTSVEITANTLNWPSHGLTTGDAMIYSRQGNAAALSRVNYYFAIVIDADNIKIADDKESAYLGTDITIGAVTGTHRMLRCGVLRDVTVLPSIIHTDDSPVAGSLTGIVVVTATSGGYHENVIIGPIGITERNATSGGIGIGIYGAHNIIVDGPQITGSKTIAMLASSGTVNGISDITGDISPTAGSGTALPDAVVRNVVARQFGTYGIYVGAGRVLVDGCDVRSSISGVVGVNFQPGTETAGTMARFNDALCPNGTAFNITNGDRNRNLSDTRSTKRELFSFRFDHGVVYKTTATAGGGTAVAAITAQSLSATTYMGKLVIHAMQSDTDNANRARYELSITKAFNGDTPAVVVLNSQGLTGGGAASHPSFTWSIASDALTATPVGSTSTATVWKFFIEWDGDIRLT